MLPQSPTPKMLEKKYHRPGTAPATLVSPDGASPMRVRVIEFDAETFEEWDAPTVEECFRCRDSGKVSWINVDGLGDADALRRLGEHFGFHPLALEDTLNVGQRPKIEEFEDHLFVVAQMVDWCKGEIRFEQMAIFLKRNVLVTVQEEPERDPFDALRARLRAGRGYARSRGHDYLAYAVLDAIVDHYFPVLESVGEELERIETELLDAPCRESAAKLHEIRRNLLRLRRYTWPQREILSHLMRDEEFVKEGTKVFLRDTYDHTVQVMEVTDGYREMAAGLMELYLSSLSQRTNEIVRVLTVISAIFVPLTFIAGVYGMNFELMPELKWERGYFMVLGFMAAVALGMLAFFKRKGWF